MGGIAVDAQKLKAFVVEVLEKAGVTSENAQIAAEVLVTADMRGTRTHGVRQLNRYVNQINRGGINTRADIQVTRSGPTWALVDGHAGLGVVTAYKAMKLAMAKASSDFVGVVSVRNSNHLGAAGYYANMCLARDMIGLVMTNADPTMSVPGSVGRVLGTNPLAYAFPAGRERSVTLDIATSTVSGVKIEQAAGEGKAVPEGWIVDRHGCPTTDPAALAAGGAHLPVGGYKGYGLALMVEILTGVLTASAVMDEIQSFARYPGEPSNVAHFFLAINIGAMVPVSEFKARLDTVVGKIRSSPRAQGVQHIYLPGELEAVEEEKAKTQGVRLDEATLLDLKLLAQDLKILHAHPWAQ
jgi:LDH2 family malate/lactate/ureidoglycolate dehydrogenase